jgi:hypothetical protein
MGPKGLLPRSQEPATCIHPKPSQSRQRLPMPLLLRSLSIIFSYLGLGLPTGFILSGLPTKMVYAFVFSLYVPTRRASHP